MSYRGRRAVSPNLSPGQRHHNLGGGGGGGGSGFTPGGLGMSDGVNSGNGQVTITYDPSTDRCRSSHDDDDDPDHETTWRG